MHARRARPPSDEGTPLPRKQRSASILGVSHSSAPAPPSPVVQSQYRRYSSAHQSSPSTSSWMSQGSTSVQSRSVTPPPAPPRPPLAVPCPPVPAVPLAGPSSSTLGPAQLT